MKKQQRSAMHEFKHRINGIRRLHQGDQSILIVITGIKATANFKGYHFRALQTGAGFTQGEKGTTAERFVTAMERTTVDKPRPRPAPTRAQAQAPVKETAQEAAKAPEAAEAMAKAEG